MAKKKQSRSKPRSAAWRSETLSAGSLEEAADRLHSAAIHLLRRLRTLDERAGISGPRASVLSVVVFRGPIAIGELATLEQVRPATISRMVKEMELEGLVARSSDPADGRIALVRATAAGRKLLGEARRRRVGALAAMLERLPPPDRETVRRAAELIESLTPGPPPRE
jgi:DNA-binding MarR family transcriptional regulator